MYKNYHNANTTELFKPTLKSNIKGNPVFYNVKF